jgi:N-acetylmuramoyl-L-alanine amidase
LAALALAVILAGQPAAAAGELARARQAREAFLQNVSGKLRHQWLDLVAEFERAADAQPRAEFAAVARLEAAQLAWRSWERFGIAADLRRVLDLSRRAVKGCSRCQSAPAAQILVGRALMAQSKPEEAYRELMKVGLNHQGAPEVAEAEALMASLAGRAPRAVAAARPSSPAAQAQTGAQGATQPKPPVAAAAQPKPPQTAARTAAQTAARTAPAAQAPPPPAAPPAPKAPTPRADGRNQLYHYRLEDRGDYTEVVAYLERVVPYLYNMLPPASEGGRFRVYFDFKDTVLAPRTPMSLRASTDLVSLVKVNQLDHQTVRLVADLPAALPYLPVFVDDPPRLVIRVAARPEALPPALAEAPPTPPPVRAQGRRPVRGPSDSMARQLGLTIRRVVIDPGHGGKDGGAAGHGVNEKDVVLAVALKLKARIERRLGLEVVLTRSGDKFVTLDRRTKTANELPADLFISLHVNANDLAKVEGLETYVLNFTSDPSAMAVAARENSSAGKSMAEMGDLVRKIAANTRVAESRVLGRALHAGTMASLRRRRQVRDLGLKEAAFIVLANVDAPAVLVEMGFVTNPGEAKLLADPAYQDLLADGLADGLAAYLEGLP